VTGIGPLRQWIRAHVKDDAVFMVDDDVMALYSLVGVRARRIVDPETVRQVVETTARCAKDAGAKIFGFNQAWDVRKFLPLKPFNFTGWVGGAIGLIGPVVFDPTLKLRADIDACLQSLLTDRIIWQDLRFAFAHHRFAGAGGNAVSRSHAAHEHEIAYLQRKWGGHLTVRHSKTALLLKVNVPRSNQPG